MEQTISNYSLLRLLGRGGMGSVYEARHTTIERRAAIKILHKEFCEDPDVVKRFMNEARAVNIIGHPGLVSVSEFGQTADGAPYIVMEYIEGITLREHLQRAGGRLPAEQVVRLSRQMASTLAAAHGKQIVHRDLKPVNIMLVQGDPDGDSGEPDRVKILDFGIAKLATETASQTKSGILMGTPTYMSPEQCRSGRSAVDRSDVYALGVIMYEMLTGEPPFRGGPAVLMAAHLMQEPAPLAKLAPGTPPELCALIHRMLAKNPSDRPPATEVARCLAPLSGQLTPPPSLLAPAALAGAAAPAGPPGDEQATVLKQAAAPTAAPRPAAPVPLNRKLLGLAALLVLLLGLAGGLLALRLRRRGDASMHGSRRVPAESG